MNDPDYFMESIRESIARNEACRNACRGVKTSELKDVSLKRLIAACEGMATEHLTPGCVAKMVEALERIRDYSGQTHITNIATAALAAMKGV